MKIEAPSILRSGRPLPPCPNPDLLGRKAARLFAEHESLAERERAIRVEAFDLHESIDGVKRAEQDAGALAARKGEPMPESAVPGIEHEANAKEAEADALKQAARAALADALDAIAEDAEATSDRADAEVAKHLRAVLAAAEGLEQGLDHLDRSFIARRWCTSVAAGEIPARHKIAYSSSLKQPNGAPYTIRALVDVIRSGVAQMIEAHGYDEPEAK